MLVPWKKSCNKPRQRIEKQRHFADRSPYSQSYDFPIVMYGCESWTIKTPQCWSIDALLSQCCRRLLRVPWIARRSNQSMIKEINPEYTLEGLMLKLKLPFFGHLTRRAYSLKDPDGKEWRPEKGTTEDEVVGLHHQLNKHEFEQAPGDDEGQGGLACCSLWGHKELDMAEQLNNKYI